MRTGDELSEQSLCLVPLPCTYKITSEIMPRKFYLLCPRFKPFCHRDHKLTGVPAKDTKQESPRAKKKTISDQTTQESDKKTPLAHGTGAAPHGNRQRKVSLSSLAAVDGPDTMKTKLVSASTVGSVMFHRWRAAKTIHVPYCGK